MSKDRTTYPGSSATSLTSNARAYRRPSLVPPPAISALSTLRARWSWRWCRCWCVVYRPCWCWSAWLAGDGLVGSFPSLVSRLSPACLPFWNFRRRLHLSLLPTSSPSLPLYHHHISSIIARYHRPGPAVVKSSISRVHIHFHHSLLPRGPSRQEAALLSMRPDTAMNQTPIRSTEII